MSCLCYLSLFAFPCHTHGCSPYRGKGPKPRPSSALCLSFCERSSLLRLRSGSLFATCAITGQDPVLSMYVLPNTCNYEPPRWLRPWLLHAALAIESPAISNTLLGTYLPTWHMRISTAAAYNKPRSDVQSCTQCNSTSLIGEYSRCHFGRLITHTMKIERRAESEPCSELLFDGLCSA